MSNVLNFRKDKNGEIVFLPEIEGFTRTVPEDSTLLNLCTKHKVSAFQIENVGTGENMILVYFTHDGWLNIYQDSVIASSKHLYFWITATQEGDDPIECVLSLFGESWILSDY